MEQNQTTQAQVLEFPKAKTGKSRKSGINKNRDGSVRNIHGNVYLDFLYLGERIRANTGLPYNKENEKTGRD